MLKTTPALYIIFISLFFNASSYGEKVRPLGDNILFAFDKCQMVSTNLETSVIGTIKVPGLDLHCVAQSDLEYKCDYFETGSSKKGAIEHFSGGKIEKWGLLKSKGQTIIKFFPGKGTASYESLIEAKDGTPDGRKFCIGIFLYETDALKRKKMK